MEFWEHSEDEGIIWIDIRYYRGDNTMTLTFYALDCGEEMEVAVFKNVSEKFAEATDKKLKNIAQDYIVYDESSCF